MPVNALVKELYDGTYTPSSKADPSAVKKYARTVGEKTGLLKGYRRLRSLFDGDPVEEPIYENHAGTLRKYFAPVARRMKNYFGDHMDFAPYFRQLRLKAQPLPTMVQRVIEIGRGYIREHIVPVGKVFGLYQPEQRAITIDPAVVPEINDPQTNRFRKWLRSYGLVNDGTSVLAHEMVHFAQDVSGAIRRYQRYAGPRARELIEGGATHTTEEMLGVHQREYPGPKRTYADLRRRVGRKAAFLGHVEPADLAYAA